MLESLKYLIRKTMLTVSPIVLYKLQHYKLHKQYGSHAYWANIKRPKTFNEHIIASKLDGSLRKGGVVLVDKYNVKSYVENKLEIDYIIPTLCICTSVEELEEFMERGFDKSCVIKPTHMSGKVIFKNKNDHKFSINDIKEMRGWLNKNHYYMTGEPQYRDLEPRIIVEPFIGENGEPPVDYKIYCWNGKPEIIQLDSSRFSGHRRNFYNISWERLDITLHYPPCKDDQPRPSLLDEMLEVAAKLAQGHKFIRVDLYQSQGKVLFGELTYHPDSGNAPFNSYFVDNELGKMFLNRNYKYATSLR